MKRGIFIMMAAVAAAAQGETIVNLKSGASGSGLPLRRQPGALVLMVEARAPDGQIAKAERSIQLADIESVETEMPPVLKDAVARLASGKAEAVLVELADAVKKAEILGDLPGSWWPRLVTMSAHAAVATGKLKEAERIAQVMKDSGNAELVLEAKSIEALVAARQGDRMIAATIVEPLTKEPLSSSAAASVSVTRGLCFLKEEKWIPALNAFLEVPVFTPDEAALLGIAHLGAAEAYCGMKDYERATATLEFLLKLQPDSHEGKRAKELLPKWRQLREALEDAKSSNPS